MKPLPPCIINWLQLDSEAHKLSLVYSGHGNTINKDVIAISDHLRGTCKMQ